MIAAVVALRHASPKQPGRVIRALLDSEMKCCSPGPSRNVELRACLRRAREFIDGRPMKILSKRWAAIAAALSVCWRASRAASAKAPAATATPQISEQVFKNVQVLKGIPLDEFMGTMGGL